MNTWTETILGSDWEWVDDSPGTPETFDITNVSGPNTALHVIGGISGPTITFDPLGLDTFVRGDVEFTIVKTLRCINTSIDGCVDGVTVVENAVPEPGTLLLLAGGLAGWAGLRRRRYS